MITHFSTKELALGCFLVTVKPFHMLCMISFWYCPSCIKIFTLIKFGAFGALKLVGITYDTNKRFNYSHKNDQSLKNIMDKLLPPTDIE